MKVRDVERGESEREEGERGREGGRRERERGIGRERETRRQRNGICINTDLLHLVYDPGQATNPGHAPKPQGEWAGMLRGEREKRESVSELCVRV